MARAGFVVAFAQPGEEHCGGADEGGGVGDVLTGDSGGGAVLGLGYGVVLAGVEGGGQTEAAGEFGRFVGEDIAEHVGGDDDVVDGGVADEEGGHAVDELLLQGDAGVAGRDIADAFEEEAVADAQDVGLVDGGDAVAPARGQGEGGFSDAGAAVSGDFAHGHCEVGRGHELAGAHEHGAVGVEAFGVLADDDEVERDAGAGGRPGRVRAGRMLA